VVRAHRRDRAGMLHSSMAVRLISAKLDLEFLLLLCKFRSVIVT